MNTERPTSNVQRSTSNGGAAQCHPAYDLDARLLEFAVRIIRVVDTLKPSLGGKTIAGQLVRSGTSPTLNHGEVQAAESRDDFIHKVSICLKELRETRRALLIAERVPLTNELDEIQALICETEQLIRIFATSIKTARRNGQPESARAREDSAAANDDHWTLDVGRWTLDVLAASSNEEKGGSE